MNVTDARENVGTTNEDLWVTVVVTTYNHARYLPDAIESVLRQTYPQIELVVVDDGSTDNTAEIASGYPDVKYIFQENKGLSSARNTGALNSLGTYIIFLDADDMLYPDAVSLNIGYFKDHPQCGFISGGHDLMTEDKHIMDVEPWQKIPTLDHYPALLQNDYISMHGAVMYRKAVFENHHYDESLSSCEDYDFYLQVARHYPIYSHNIKLAAYRKHAESMSENIVHMYRSAMRVMHKQTPDLENVLLKESWLAGKRDIRQHYSALLLHQWTSCKKQQKMDLRRLVEVFFLLSSRDMMRLGVFYVKFFFYRLFALLRATLIRVQRIVQRGSRSFVPKPGKVWMGDLDSVKPFSRTFGYDRGGPVDRYYIERFLADNADFIQGNVLEIGDNFYTLKYGGNRVTRSDVLYVDDSNPAATIIGDLSKAGHIPSESFDCIILTQTLHLMYDFKAALAHCHRLLKKEGALLMTVPGITSIDYGEWGDTWYWSFTGNVINKLLEKDFGLSNVRTRTYGNVLAASSFLYGLGEKELKVKELDQHDPCYQVIIAAAAIKNEQDGTLS